MNNLLETWTQALGWALLHSLWQFGIIGLSATLLLSIFRNHSSNLRYQIIAGALLLSFVIFSATISWQLIRLNAIETAHQISTNQVFDGKEQPVYASEVDEVSVPEIKTWRDWLSDHLHWLVLFWVIGVLIFSVRFGANYLLLNYLRYEGNRPADENWRSKLQELQNKMGIQRAVQLLESAIVKAPMTFGQFKPVILVPFGLLTSLPPDQVEALLLHELAHIRRHDFLINLLVGVLETLLFYHPAIWWLRARLRELREECCDDLVVAQGTSRITYAESLLAISQTSKIQLAMNAKNHSSHFSVRIRRLLMPETPSRLPRPAVSAIVAILFIITTAFGSVFAQKELVVSVAIDKMNVLYIGVDNPVTVAVSGISNEDIKVSSEDLKVIPQGDGKYILQASKPGEAIIKVESNGKLLKESIFRVKRIPDPMPLLGRSSGGKIQAEEFKKQKELKALLANFDFDAQCEIESFSLIRIARREDAVEAINKSNVFQQASLDLIQQASSGDTYYFHNIKVKCPGDKGTRDLDTMLFQIKE
ncbi:MAG: GldM family protein [Saprospiraceae bacterium]|nr:GldM family protein [Saprospiraceae bacterium]